VKPNTLGEMLWAMEANSLGKFQTALKEHGVSGETLNSMHLEHVSRYFKPWPNWVFNIAAEVFGVHFPSISKQTFIAVLKNIHWFIFEAPIHGASTTHPPFSLPPDFRNDLLRFIGHMEKHLDLFSIQISEIEALQLSSSERLELQKIKMERKENIERFQKALCNYLFKKGNITENVEVIVDAKRATLDSKGRIRESPATKMYLTILKSWPEVESLSGPKELCQFLSPFLGTKSGIANQERVKKLVQRMGIVFVPELSRDIRGTS
jgi:hypothetical protein